MSDKAFWTLIREALLLMLDALERWLGQAPTTSEIRRQWKRKR